MRAFTVVVCKMFLKTKLFLNTCVDISNQFEFRCFYVGVLHKEPSGKVLHQTFPFPISGVI